MYPKRLIEVDLPIARISAHARREKSIRHGHISTLHIWWARRPLAACRAVICAALWPDPADENCPQAFRDAAARRIMDFARRADGDMKLLATSSEEGKARWASLVKKGFTAEDAENAEGDHLTSSASLRVLRGALLDFIADFANWDNSTVPDYLETSRALTQAAHEALGGEPGTRPLVVDPFAGGGSIPLEALRVGADAFASDLNPVAVLLNKVVLEYIPKYGQRLADEVRKWGRCVQEQAQKELAAYFPTRANGAVPVTYLWARTIECEGPGCGATVPLIRSLWISKVGRRSIAIRLVPRTNKKCVDIEVISNAQPKDVGAGTVKRGSVTCPNCGYTTPVARVREQLKEQLGGADTSQLLVVVTRDDDTKDYHSPTKDDIEAVAQARRVIDRKAVLEPVELPLMSGVFNAPIYGVVRWDLLFSARQLLGAHVLGETIRSVCREMPRSDAEKDIALAVKVLLLLARGKYLDFHTTLCRWISVGEKIGNTFGRQALGMIFDWAEGVPFGDMSGSWDRCVEYIAEFLEAEATTRGHQGTVERADAQSHPLPNDSACAIVTDPPYYNAVPYADLSEFFYLWLRRDLDADFPSLFSTATVEKTKELCEMKGWDPLRYPEKDAKFYEEGMELALTEGRRECVPSGIGVIVFAHKTTAGWETLLSALISSGWIVTGSWPIDTERGGRLRAMSSAALASSVHLVCRPRENQDGSLAVEVGEWRDVLGELPNRIHDWMPRLAAEGVVGADAIFACLGPALEVFSRYSRVEKASGETATLQEYLEHVWAAVSTEALSMIFEDADAAGLEPDARLTAMWLWTLGGGSGKVGANGNGNGPHPEGEGEETDADDSDEGGGKGAKVAGYVLEFDAARKIAQGLGIHLEKSESIVEVKGDKARLLPVAERTQYLFGRAAENGKPSPRPSPKGRGRRAQQKTFFEELDEAQAADAGWGELKGPPPGSTVLDRLHQAMILFAAGRGELLKRFLVEEGIGTDARFWKLAQSFSALYPRGSEEKRWVDGVLARKKGLGF